ncbi:MAG TPA: hypothetical protein VF974_04940 [Patescibacteria group bacterium]
MKPKVKYPLKEHWDKFEAGASWQPKILIAYVKTILGEEISPEAFLIAYHRVTKGIPRTTPARGKQLYKFLTENNWIKKG